MPRSIGKRFEYFGKINGAGYPETAHSGLRGLGGLWGLGSAERFRACASTLAARPRARPPARAKPRLRRGLARPSASSPRTRRAPTRSISATKRSAWARMKALGFVAHALGHAHRARHQPGQVVEHRTLRLHVDCALHGCLRTRPRPRNAADQLRVSGGDLERTSIPQYRPLGLDHSGLSISAACIWGRSTCAGMRSPTSSAWCSAGAGWCG